MTTPLCILVQRLITAVIQFSTRHLQMWSQNNSIFWSDLNTKCKWALSVVRGIIVCAWLSICMWIRGSDSCAVLPQSSRSGVGAGGWQYSIQLLQGALLHCDVCSRHTFHMSTYIPSVTPATTAFNVLYPCERSENNSTSFSQQLSKTE